VQSRTILACNSIAIQGTSSNFILAALGSAASQNQQETAMLHEPEILPVIGC